jgi:hypothetical protein
VTAAKRKTTSTADVAASVAAFVGKIKDDPSLSDDFRAAANELHSELGGDTEDTAGDEG